MKIQELLSDEFHWTQGALARDLYGDACDVYDDDAICWCLVGAIYYCYSSKDAGIITQRLEERGINDPQSWNDCTTWEHVRELVTTLDI